MSALFGSLRSLGQTGYVALAWGIVALVWLQVFFAGLGVLASPAYWVSHTLVGHMFSPVIAFMFIMGLVGRMPIRWVLYCVGLFVLYSFQFLFLHLPPDHLSVMRGLHAANALVLLLVALSIARSSFRLYVEASQGSLKVHFGVMVGVVAACFVMLMRWVAP